MFRLWTDRVARLLPARDPADWLVQAFTAFQRQAAESEDEMVTSGKNAADQAAQQLAEREKERHAETVATPAAGAHAAGHLTNEDATPGSGALTSRAHTSGKEVDGGAG